jgi:hypothetical protein
MTRLLDNVRNAMSSPRGGRQVCLACGRRIARTQQSKRLRGGAVVHLACAVSAPRRAARGV